MKKTMEDQLKDHLFEWFLAQFLDGQVKSKIRPTRQVKRKPAAPIRADLKNIYLRYDDQAQLNLADVKPTGFLVKSNG